MNQEPTTIRVLTLRQPWATLVAIGAKTWETRSRRIWGSYHGPLAIHAAKSLPLSAEHLCFTEPFRSALRKGGYDWTRGALWNMFDLPVGHIIAVCDLVDSVATTSGFDAAGQAIIDPRVQAIQEPERSFGDFSSGRYIAKLENVRRLAKPIAAHGSLGMWRCDWALIERALEG